MTALLALLPARDYFYAALIIALIAFGVYERNHLIDEGITHETAAVTAASAKAEAAADAKIKVLTAQHEKTVEAIEEDYAQHEQANIAQRSADADRLREYDAYRRAHGSVASAASGPAATIQAASDASGGDEILERLESISVDLAASLRDEAVALSSCMVERDALTGK